MVDDKQPDQPPADPLEQEAFDYGVDAARGLLANAQDHAMHSDPIAINTTVAAGFLVFATEKGLAIGAQASEGEVNRVVTLAKAFVFGFAAAYDRAHPQESEQANDPAAPPPPPKDDGVPMFG